MSSSAEEEDSGPSVDSNNPEERVAARRNRIQHRIEALKRAALGEDVDCKKEAKEEISKSRKQMEESRLRLNKLHRDGFELVTNIRVAGDARESNRRGVEEETKRQRKERLEQEVKVSTERFDEITKKWEIALQKELPQSLHEMLILQKKSCDLMIDEKNKIITDFQQDLKNKDDHYVKDLKKMADDVDLMTERMEEQINNVMKANRDEMEQIEARKKLRAFVAERNELLELHKRKWDEKMNNRREKEEEFMNQRLKRVEENEQQLQHLRVQDTEEYNIVKVRLETDVQVLEQQLQQMKSTYQLNQEKLEYNFQVLKKRDEENTITKSQQKRKITRLQDVLNVLRQKLSKQEKQYKSDNEQLTEDYKRVTEQFHDLQRKSKHFLLTDAQKFHQVWCMNEEECRSLLDDVLAADRAIHEQQLGLPWPAPDLSFTETVGPLLGKDGATKIVSASEVVKEVFSHTVAEDMDKNEAEKEEDEEIERPGIFSKISALTIKHILELLCDESGFLVESKLNKLLAPLEKDERSLIKLDAIFSALAIETEEDIHKLSTYFMHIPDDSPDEHKKQKDAENEDEEGGQRNTEGGDLDEEVCAMTENEGPDPKSADAFHLIHPNEILKALRAFVEENRQPIEDKSHKSQFRITALEERESSGDSEYWMKYNTALSNEKEKVWDGLLDGLETYSEILNKRASLLSETDTLRTQNAELRLLLHQYVNSKVNAELQIPPSKVLQVELNEGYQ